MLHRLARNALALLAVSTLAAAQSTTRASVGTGGVQANGYSNSPSISGVGHLVAFSTYADTLVSGDTNGMFDIFVHDQTSGVTQRVSVSSGGIESNWQSYNPTISADGRFVSFDSEATNLVTGDLNGRWDVFLHDRQSGTTDRVSLSTAGGEGDADSAGSSLSSDGRYVAFTSSASNLVSGDANGSADVFVHDRITGVTERVSVGSSGIEGNGGSGGPSISSDGRFVAFSSVASNLTAGDGNGLEDVFVHDRQTGTTQLVSIDASGIQGNGRSSVPSLSADGRMVAFISAASNLVSGDTNGSDDIYVHDCQGGSTQRVSIDSGGAQANGLSSTPSISGNGRFVAFASTAPNLVAADNNGSVDVFVHDMQFGGTVRASVADNGSEGAGSADYWPSISEDGRYVAFRSGAANLVAGDTNSLEDIFVRDRGTSDCNGNGIDDAQDISSGTSTDCDGDSVPDECELLQGAAVDCDGNGLLDACEIAATPSLDLNHDGQLDSCPLNCQAFWQTYIGGTSGMDGTVNAMIVFDDGSGPAQYVAGSFQSAGGVPASQIAKWDGSTWSALGSGVSGGEVRALAVYDDGGGSALYVGGSFTMAGGVFVGGVARWNGQTWSPLGPSSISSVVALAVYDYGTGPRLYVATPFVSWPILSSSLFAWDGSSWTAVDLGQFPGVCLEIGALAVYDSGTGPALFVGGRDVCDYFAISRRWNGSSWIQQAYVGYLRIAGFAIHNAGSGLSLYAAFADHGGGTGSIGGVAELIGNVWTFIGTTSGGVTSLCSFDDGGGESLFASGGITGYGGLPMHRIMKWTGTAWSELGDGANDTINALCVFNDGSGPAMYVGGNFSAVNNSPANHIASWGLPQGCVPTGTVICEPGTNGVMACPCSNPPTTAGRGCNNSSGTGGAQLTTSGFARLGTDNLVLTTSGEKPGASSIVLQGSVSSSTGFTFGQGVRCVSGSLKRLYLKTAIAGSITAPGASDLSVSARSAALGSPIAPGMHRYYGVYYRDPVILGGCPAASGFNITQQLDVLWHP